MKRFLKNAKTGMRPVSELLLIAMLLMGCSDNHLIKDTRYIDIIETAFNKRKQLSVNRDSALFSVFKNKLSLQQSEALKFLYAYMPLSDLADYNGDFFLSNVDIALRSRSETIWGRNIPDDIFLHYVLPIRINNENLDSFRIVYYNELLGRVKGKNLKDAGLEINHWCHEKVSYQPADIRTSSPMSTILSARGRCGEESTFTVAALRTVGIPARQVYTPRWAHTDDNHAWVEIWADGYWYYMGACEPEPFLDQGWFTEPARRAMLVHTKSFGASFGKENAINSNKNYTNVNNLEKYADTKKIYVKVTDNDNFPVNNALVEYQLYNYAEFFPLAVVPTDSSGISRFETGLGDLLVWAHKDDKFDFQKISVGETDTLILNIDREMNPGSGLNLDLNVPVIHFPLPTPQKELIAANSEKIIKENLIRQKYIDSWMKPVEAKILAERLKTDTARTIKIITRSMGNYKEISEFLTETPDSLLPLALSILEILPDKDLRDTRRHILADHLINCSLPIKDEVKVEVEKSKNIFNEYVLNPRVANELLVAWRLYFQKVLPSDLAMTGLKDPLNIVNYLNDNIKISDEENYYKTPLTPVGVNELKVSDKDSRAICFVAICRSLGIPARLEPGSNVPQYLKSGIWNDIWFSDQKRPDGNKGFLTLKSTDTNQVPQYYVHFTLAKFEGGRYNTLEFEYNKKIGDFQKELPLLTGHYMLVTGNRLNDGRILSNVSFFDLSEKEHKIIEVKIRKDITEKKILGSIDLKRLNALPGLTGSSQSCTNDKGCVIFWIDPETEPTKHIFNDLPLLKKELDDWGGKFLFLSVSGSFVPIVKEGLPVNSSFGTDKQMMVLKDFAKINLVADIKLPLVLTTDSEGNILFVSTGYRIGIGEQILKSVNH
jgi:transglutaminase-like putative cysteine protease